MNIHSQKAIEMCLEKFKLLSSLAASTCPIKSKGKPVAFKKIVLSEAKLASAYLELILDGYTHDRALEDARALPKGGE